MRACIDLIKKTPAYRALIRDKAKGTLSHAYLFVSQDVSLFREYAKIFAAAIVCGDSEEFCGSCRRCRLIFSENYADADFYPADGAKNIVVSDIDSLTEKSYVRPIEGKKRIFCICGAQNMNEQAQNKLLKTLEEPPENVHIILLSSGEYALLPTVLSRVKKLDIPLFETSEIAEALKGEFDDADKLYAAAASSGGLLGKTVQLMQDENFLDMVGLSLNILVNMQKSGDVLHYTNLILKYKDDLNGFLNVFQIIARDVLMFKTGRKELVLNKDKVPYIARAAMSFPLPALIEAVERITSAMEALKVNTNVNMTVDALLFDILEGKYRWRK